MKLIETMESKELLDNFTKQREEVAQKLQHLELEMNKNKEIYFKLQGAIEALEMVDKKPESDQVEASPEAVAAVLQ